MSWAEDRRLWLVSNRVGSSEEAVAEDEASLEDPMQTVMEVPRELVPAVRELIAKHGAA